VGRDHAGVGSYYGPYDAQKIFDDFQSGELGITPCFSKTASSADLRRNGLAENLPSYRCRTGHPLRVQVRELLSQKQLPPMEFSRPEVAKILMG